MGEILSQEEIDSLLSALNSGEYDVDDYKDSPEKSIIVYDFARPTKFSKDHLRTLVNIFEHYGRLLSTNLPGYLRKSVQVEVINSESVIYSEFANALSNPVLLGVVSFAPLKGSVIIEWGPNLGYAMIDRMLGGFGLPLEKNRDFSEIEMAIIERVFTNCVSLLREPWKNVAHIEPRLERIETNTQFAQIISPGETIAIVTISIKIGDVEGMMNVCLPYVTLEPIMDKLNTKYWFASLVEQDEGHAEAMEIMLEKAEVPITVLLGKSSISVNDFVNLQKGDIIKVGTKIDEELDVYVGKIKKFKALPGTASDKYAVRVTSIIREE
ncbi:MAG: flagellar motor switch protein FliM [Lachnospiraceae bacterium]|nr:flagellar motor switch protein FliM [Lachnospiraceae bacterium]